ncbi:pilin [Glaesserella parasuis]|uniref:pilin n=1 Tax=Glaesserella parasuis TaxID=738 RepID=UPI0024368933|nr:prepilin-type N-terminal cleavage/methylation domain-containing protein [Glaesserella parasuis]MDG6410696.1 prepilin-type N-terminal cleavage/methylation domain-containing protein [Glaesserella parasuis]
MKKIRLIRPLAKAFTLIELMIVIAIIAILVTIAIPSYTSYTQKAALSELLSASASYKSDVADAKYLKSISVASGTITVEGKGNIDGYGYTMTPTLANNNITWTTSCRGSDTSLFPANFCGQ